MSLQSPDLTQLHQWHLQRVRLAIGLLLAGVAVLALTLTNTGLSVSALGWIFMICGIAWPLWLDARLRAEAFDPASYFVFNGVVAYGMPALVLMLYTPLAAAESEFALAMVLVGLSFFAFWTGFRSSVGKGVARLVPLVLFNRSPWSARGPMFWLMAGGLYWVGWIGRLARASAGITHLPVDLGTVFRYASLLRDLHTFATLSYVLMVYALLKRSGGRGWQLLLCVTLLLLEMVAGSIYGSRTLMVLPALQFAVAYHFAVRPLRWRTLLLAFVGAFIVLAPLLTLYRDSYYRLLLRGGNVANASLAASAIELSARRMSEGDFGWSATLEENAGERLTSTLQGTVRVLERVPELYPYQRGETFLPGLGVMFIPRAVWPDKPVFLPGRDFAVRFFDTEADRVFGTSMAIGMPAEAYFNFWWFGVLLFLPLGVLFRALAERLRAYRVLDPTFIVRLFFVLFVVADTTESLLYYFGNMVRESLAYFVLLVLVTRQLPRLGWMQAPGAGARPARSGRMAAARAA